MGLWLIVEGYAPVGTLMVDGLVDLQRLYDARTEQEAVQLRNRSLRTSGAWQGRGSRTLAGRRGLTPPFVRAISSEGRFSIIGARTGMYLTADEQGLPWQQALDAYRLRLAEGRDVLIGDDREVAMSAGGTRLVWNLTFQPLESSPETLDTRRAPRKPYKCWVVIKRKPRELRHWTVQRLADAVREVKAEVRKYGTEGGVNDDGHTRPFEAVWSMQRGKLIETKFTG